MSDPTNDGSDVLDVRPIPRPERHKRVFALFMDLPVGGAFHLVNDHDPKPLRSQFVAKFEDAFSWDYVESGPEEWKVRIGKTAEPPDQGLPVLRTSSPAS